MDHSQRQTIWQDTKQALTNSRKLKLYQGPSQITMLQWVKIRTNLRGKKTTPQKHSNTWRLDNISLNNEWVNNEIKEEIKKNLETNGNDHTTNQNHSRVKCHGD